MSLIIKNGRGLNPPTNTEEILDIKIDGNNISAVEAEIVPVFSDEVIDATGCLVFPGFIDMHVHFRDLGQTAKEDIETGSRAAARGGVTTVLAMPNSIREEWDLEYVSSTDDYDKYYRQPVEEDAKAFAALAHDDVS